jgi:hypothetical protein
MTEKRRQYNIGEESVCGGCPKRRWLAVGYCCIPYENPKKTTAGSVGECYFNPHVKAVQKERVRVGQQKTKGTSG